MNKTIQSFWSCDAATGDLYENNHPAGKLITGNSPHPGAWLRLIQQANASAELFSALENLDREITALEMFGETGNTASKKNVESAQTQARAALEKAGGL